jgi:hypothetical protein
MTNIYTFQTYVNAAKLGKEILSSALNDKYEAVHLVALDKVRVIMNSVLSTSQELVLQNIIDQHINTPLEEEPQEFDITPTVSGIPVLLKSEAIFGKSIDHAKNQDTTSTTSTSWIKSKTQDTMNLEAGTYLIGYSVEVASNKNNGTTHVKLDIDDSSPLMECNPSFNKSYSFLPLAGQYVMDLTGGIHTINISYKTDQTQNTALLRNPSIYYWRIK